MPDPRGRNLAGEHFGRWEVVALSPTEPGRGLFFFCRCACGTERIVSGRDLTRSRKPSRSCGCLHDEQASELHRDDLTGRQFGDLTVVAPAPSAAPTSQRQQRRSRWLCRCICGREGVVEAANLLRRPPRPYACRH